MMNEEPGKGMSIGEEIRSRLTAMKLSGNIHHFMSVAVKLPTGAIEMITNVEKVESKIDYYLDKYDDEMVMRANPLISIVGMTISPGVHIASIEDRIRNGKLGI